MLRFSAWSINIFTPVFNYGRKQHGPGAADSFAVHQGQFPCDIQGAEGYLRDKNVPDEDIKRILVDEIVEEPFSSSQIKIRSPVGGEPLPPLTYKTLSYDGHVVVLENERPGILGLKESQPADPGLKEPPKRTDGILPSPDTVIPIIDREYIYCKTENEILDVLRH